MQLEGRTDCHQGYLNLTLKFSALQKWSAISAIIHPWHLDEKIHYLPLKKGKSREKKKKVEKGKKESGYTEIKEKHGFSKPLDNV